jgi:diaminopimelate epimerase
VGGSMSSVVISGDTSGAITLAAPAVAGTNTLTLPAQTGTVMVNGPAFSYYPNTLTTIADSTQTKLVFDGKDFDTANAVSSSRFTPQVAGYYQINADMRFASTFAATQIFMSIYKNGSVWTRGAGTGSATIYAYATVNGIVYCNGSTDYIEIYVYQNSGISQSDDNSTYYKFSGCLLRTA